jgi:hypothetical protein
MILPRRSKAGGSNMKGCAAYSSFLLPTHHCLFTPLGGTQIDTQNPALSRCPSSLRASAGEAIASQALSWRHRLRVRAAERVPATDRRMQVLGEGQVRGEIVSVSRSQDSVWCPVSRRPEDQPFGIA